MIGLDKLKKRSLTDLRKLAKKSGIKFSAGWTRTKLATKILEKQKLDELKEDVPVQPESESGKSERKPDFENLATEGPEIAPDSLQDEKPGPGGIREGAGRTPGLTEEKARVQTILNNQVPDPTIKFAFECLFDGWESAVKVKGIALSPDETNTIAVPTTNLKQYYFPNLNLSPVLELWIGLSIGIKTVVQSRIVLIRETRKAEQVKQTEQSEQPGDDSKP